MCGKQTQYLGTETRLSASNVADASVFGISNCQISSLKVGAKQKYVRDITARSFDLKGYLLPTVVKETSEAGSVVTFEPLHQVNRAGPSTRGFGGLTASSSSEINTYGQVLSNTSTSGCPFR